MFDITLSSLCLTIEKRMNGLVFRTILFATLFGNTCTATAETALFSLYFDGVVMLNGSYRAERLVYRQVFDTNEIGGPLSNPAGTYYWTPPSNSAPAAIQSKLLGKQTILHPVAFYVRPDFSRQILALAPNGTPFGPTGSFAFYGNSLSGYDFQTEKQTSDLAADPAGNVALMTSLGTYRPFSGGTTTFRMTLGTDKPGDFDSDGDVDGRDFLRWQRGQSPTANSWQDLLDWQFDYDAANQNATVHAVPEPTAWVISSLTLLLAVSLRRIV
jgi:hypothetical protein